MSTKAHLDPVWCLVDINADQSKAFGVGAAKDLVGPFYPAYMLRYIPIRFKFDLSQCSISTKVHLYQVWHLVDINADQSKAFGVGAAKDLVGPSYPASMLRYVPIRFKFDLSQ